MIPFQLRPLEPSDQDWVRRMMVAEWGSEIVAVHGEVIRPSDLPGFIAELEGQPVGLLTYAIRSPDCEIVTLNSWRPGFGVGTMLIEAVKQEALREGCRRLFLVTTNDNTPALRFYQKRGFVLSDLRPNAIAESRKLKPEIPLTGQDGIPIRDEIELEMSL